MQRVIQIVSQIGNGELQPEHIRTATVVRLPYHLCTGSLFELADPDDNRFQVWLRNKVSIPHGTDIHEAMSVPALRELLGAPSDHFLTEALIVDRSPRLRSGEFEAVRDRQRNSLGWASPANPGFRLLNEIVAAHQMVRVGPYIAALGNSWPRMLSTQEIFAGVLLEFVLIIDVEEELSEDLVLALFRRVDHWPRGIQTGGTGDTTDYSPDQLAELKGAIRKLRSHAFYELKTNAVSAILQGNSIVALVLACAAAEGAHGAFLRLALRDGFSGDAGRFHDMVDRRLRRKGFYKLVQSSVRELLKDDERPDADKLAECLVGLQMRNGIMHASVSKSGQYKVREYTESELNEAYGGLMAVYFAFEAAVEVREAVPGG